MNTSSLITKLSLASLRFRFVKPALATAVLLAAALGGNAQAQDSWTGAADANWSNGANWSGGAAPNGAQGVFGVAGVAGTTLNDDTGTFAYGLDFTAAAPAYTINSNNGSIVINAINPIENDSTATQTFNVGIEPFAPTGGAVLTTTSTGNLVFNGVISDFVGSSPITVSGTGGGAVVLGAANTFSGGATVSGGSTLELTNANALQGSALTMNGSNASPTTQTLKLLGNGSTTFNMGTQSTNGVTNNIYLSNYNTQNNTFTFDVGSTGSAGVMSVGTVVFSSYFNGTDYQGTLNATNSNNDGSGLSVASIQSALFAQGFGEDANVFTINSSINNANGLTVGTFSGDNNFGTRLTISGTGNTTFTGAISDGAAPTSVTVAGPGVLTYKGASTYSGGTTISGGTVYVNNTTGSGTGSGAVTVTGGTLAGSGTISGAVTIQSGGVIASGPAQTNVVSPTNPTGVDTVTGPGLTVDLAVNGGSTLQFDLGAGASTGYLNYASPNPNSTSLTSTGPTTFGTTGGNVNISLVDLTAFSASDTLQLRSQNPYLLISAAGDSSYNLVTTGGYDANGLVLGIGSSGTGTSVLNGFNITAQDINGGALVAPYNNLQLYLYNGQLEVIPEPGTWALMLGGLALLVLIQRRRRDHSA